MIAPLGVTRRDVLVGAAATLAAPAIASSARVMPMVLTAAPATASLFEDLAIKTEVWAYNDQICGPVIRARKGEDVAVRFKNRLEQPTTVHWHGIRIDNRMDGVANLTQPPVEPGESYDYRFVAPDAGTYWYHPHNRTWEQMARGLSGPLIIEETEPVDVDGDHILHMTNWLLDDAGALHEESLGSPRDWSHAGRMGNILTINGKPRWSLAARAGSRQRLRFINASNARVLGVQIAGHRLHAVAYDGQPLAQPMDLGFEPATLAPAQRVDVIVDLTEIPGYAADLIVTSNGGQTVAGTLTYSDEAPLTLRDDLYPLPQNTGLATPDLQSARTEPLVMEGGAMGWLVAATYRGREIDGRTLARSHNQFWAFNGVAAMPEAPLFTAKRGETIRLDMENRTRWPHAIHFHGHHGVEVERSGGMPRAGFHDTVLLDIDERVSVAFVADNPGKWMIHCHMLEHQASGMATWFAVD